MGDVLLQDITHRYSDKEVLSNITLTIPHGSFFTLLGPSGCGKTTLLRILAGFISPSEGRVILDGNDVTQVGAEKRNMGVVFQNYALFPNMTVEENIAYGLKVRKVASSSIESKCNKVMELVGLEEYRTRHVQELSGGQQQRVAIARALVIEPQMLLLDEPMSNLDVSLRIKMREEIRSIQQSVGITTLFITHDQQEALSISDWVAVMREGTIEQVGTPEDIYNNPANPFVANFVGYSNTLHGRNVRPEQLCLIDSATDGIPVRITSKRFVGLYYEYTVESLDIAETYRVIETNNGSGISREVGQTCFMKEK